MNALEKIGCGSNTSSPCDGSLVLVRLRPDQDIKIDEDEEVILETKNFEMKYQIKAHDYLVLLMCDKCGKLYSKSSNQFLTSKGNYIHYYKGNFYVDMSHGRREFIKITKMLIYPKTGTATKAKVKTKESWSDC